MNDLTVSALIGMAGTVLGVSITVFYGFSKDIILRYRRKNDLYYFVFIFCDFLKDIVALSKSDEAPTFGLYERLTNIHREELCKQRNKARELDAEVTLSLMHLFQALENLDKMIESYYKNKNKNSLSLESKKIHSIKYATSLLEEINNSLAWYCFKKMNFASKLSLYKKPFRKELSKIKRNSFLPSNHFDFK